MIAPCITMLAYCVADRVASFLVGASSSSLAGFQNLLRSAKGFEPLVALSNPPPFPPDDSWCN
jgi:hypothetical protein